MYQKNDLVKYIGDYTKLNPVERDEDYAEISNLIKYEHYWVVDLHLLKSTARLSCLADKIRPIETEEIHLTRLGFNVLNYNNGKYYERDGVLLSSVTLQFPHNRFVFISGLCIGDLRNLTEEEMKSFIVKGEFNIELFYSKYPSVQNLNHLCTEIASKKWPFDIKSICY